MRDFTCHIFILLLEQMIGNKLPRRVIAATGKRKMILPAVFSK